jgi:flavin reductase (DIM6/NTAB) family NADH-FMN oxidoreductase RutF/rubredoxin
MDTMVLRNLSYGLFVIGTKDGNRPTGCTVNTVIQVQSEPALITVCINKNNFTNQCIKAAKGFSVSILSENNSVTGAGEIIGTFGFRSGKDTDKFASIPFETTEGGFPALVNGSCGWLECTLESFTELQTHTLFVGRLTDAKIQEGAPMTYAYYHRVIRGSTAPKSPIYEKPREGAGIWTCPACGYVYDGSSGPFEKLPGDWRCPICGVPKDKFTKTA